ncbi:MAG TPA: hypothetical protein VGC30_12600, partial [Dokdonella sp.]
MAEPRQRVWVARPFFDDLVERLREHFDVEAETADRAWSKAEVAAKLADKHGAILSVADRVDADVLARAPHLRAIANAAVGYDNLDLDALAARGVVATNTPGVLDDAVADYQDGQHPERILPHDVLQHVQDRAGLQPGLALLGETLGLRQTPPQERH